MFSVSNHFKTFFKLFIQLSNQDKCIFPPFLKSWWIFFNSESKSYLGKFCGLQNPWIYRLLTEFVKRSSRNVCHIHQNIYKTDTPPHPPTYLQPTYKHRQWTREERETRRTRRRRRRRVDEERTTNEWIVYFRCITFGSDENYESFIKFSNISNENYQRFSWFSYLKHYNWETGLTRSLKLS